jgi:prefoldin beta subunit
MNEDIQELQKLEQNLQGYAQQRQSLKAQELEFTSALSELDTTEKAYKIIGTIMVSSEKEELKKDLASKKTLLEKRLEAIEKQEKKLQEKYKELQQKVMKEMESDQHGRG